MVAGNTGLDFDPAKEDVKVTVEMLPNRYVKINGDIYSLEKRIVFDENSGTKVRKYIPGKFGRIDVPKRVADLLLTTKPNTREKNDDPPMARMIKSITKPGPVAKETSQEADEKPKEKSRRKAKEDE